MISGKFEAFPKMSRYSREAVVTEKIDGTNAQIYIELKANFNEEDLAVDTEIIDSTEDMVMWAGSRSRIITPENDNFGFARWVKEHSKSLFDLGPGRHFGEWWGSGVQRGYGITKGEKRFSLFNTHRWSETRPDCCHVVPVLATGLFCDDLILSAMKDLEVNGSKAAPGFMKPEGIVVFHTHSSSLFKKTFEKDQEGKG